jgi:FixJ family two-component response regulator
MRRSVERLLNAYGFRAVSYSSADTFLGRDAATQINCIVLDVYLGGMSGIELCHRLKASGSILPVIFITAVDDDAIELKAIQAGCVGFLHKPFPTVLLIDAVNKALADS